MEEALAERRKTVTLSVRQLQDSDWYEKGKTYSQVIRVIAEEIEGEVNPQSLEKAEKYAWSKIQQEAKVVEKIRKPLKAELRDGLWRINTRLSMREDCQEFLWPVYLPKDHHMVHMLIVETHERMAHAGPGIVIAELRKKVWIQQGKKIANHLIKKCYPCRIQGAKKLKVQEAPLPKYRTSLGRVFETTGIDYAGPLYTRAGKKVYFALFKCATYRAIHLELVLDLTTEAFIQAFRRFRNRRGNPKLLCSDNGTNFRGYDNLMRAIDWEKVKREFEFERIQWDFNPPSAPWWGGYWERLVGIVKPLLRRILGNRSLDEEELRTVLTDVEAVVNARPLTYLGENDDWIPLTPNSFLMDVPFVEAVDMDLVEDAALRKRFQYRQRLREDFRRRFRLEYLGTLKSNNVVKSDQEIRLNDIVMIEVDNQMRIAWPIGRVVELFPSQRDGAIRLVKVKTQSGEVMRPVQRLVKLGSELSSAEAAEVQKQAKKVHVLPPEVQEEVTLDHPKDINGYRTRSGRLVKQPDRLMYLLAGFKFLE